MVEETIPAIDKKLSPSLIPSDAGFGLPKFEQAIATTQENGYGLDWCIFSHKPI